MADTGSTLPHDPNVQDVEEKGKGKAISEDVPQDDVMDDDEDDDSSDDDEEEQAEGATEEDGMEEIDLNNIVDGPRTRGQQIDFAKAAEETPADDDDDEDDDDFQPPDEDTKMSG